MKMNVGQMLLKAGSVALRTVFPPAGVVIDMVNDFLPDDKKLPADATGNQVKTAMDALPPDKRAEILSKEMDVEIEEIQSWTQIVQALAEVDKSGASTRPESAKMMAQILAFQLILCTSVWAIAVLWDKTEMVTRLANSWELILAFMGYPMWVIKRYFGARETDKKTRASVAMGQAPVPGGFAALASIFKR